MPLDKPRVTCRTEHDLGNQHAHVSGECHRTLTEVCLERMIEAIEWARDFGPVGLLALGVLAMASSVVILPRAVLSVVGGVTFGFWAIPTIVLGSTLGSALAFVAARYLMRERLAKVAARRPKVQAYLDSLGAEGWKVVILLRLGPLPGTPLNYLAGVTRLRLRVFSGATIIGMAPPVALYASLGTAGRGALDGPGPEVGLVQTVLLGVGVMTTIAAATVICRAAQTRLAQVSPVDTG
jgi:uncharacterized membrane protein YdjX (TVP38/TMEM64 family)